MRCLSDSELVKAELGELTVNQLDEVDRHAAACSLCSTARQEIRTLVADLSDFRPPTSAESFVESVMGAREEHAGAPEVTPVRRARRLWPRRSGPAKPRRLPVIPTVLGAAAAVLLALGTAELASTHRSSHLAEPGTFTARGRAGRVAAPKASSEVMVVRRDRLLLLSGQSLSPSDRFAVRYVNRSERTQFLAAFAVDNAGTVHWIYPEYTDESTDPQSTPLPATEREQVLPQIVAPDHPAPGPMHVIAMTSPEPATVKQIERAIKLAPPGAPVVRTLQSRFSRSLVQEWSCLWNSQPAEAPSSLPR